MTAADLDLEALREVVAKGTPGPWEVTGAIGGTRINGPKGRWVAGGYDTAYSDAALIVAAVNALPMLIDEVERLAGMQVHIKERIGEPTTCRVTYKGVPIFVGQNYDDDTEATYGAALVMVDTLRDENAALTAERDAALAEVKELWSRIDREMTAEAEVARLREEVRVQIVARDGQHDRRVIAETERDIALARVTELENGIRGLVQVRHDEDPAPFYAAFRRLTALLPADTEGDA